MGGVMKKLEDFSVVFVKGVERMNIPGSFVFEDSDVYVGPASSSVAHKKVPYEVSAFFSKNRKEVVFEHAGWMYFVHGYADSGFYTRSQERRSIVVDRVAPYVERLDGFVNKEVAVKDVLPSFEKNPFYPGYDIPDSGFQLVLSERSSVVDIVVAEIDRGFGRLSDVASIAKFVYEGR